MELEVIVGTYDCSIIGYSIDLLSLEKPVLKKKYFERDHVGCVRCVATGGQYLASGGTDETIKLYNMRKHVEIGSLLHHQGTITCLMFYKNSHMLSCSEDGSVCIWKCGGSWDCLHTLSGHKHPVSCVAVHPSGRLAISVGRDRTVRTWNLLTGRAAFTLRLPQAAELVVWNPIGSQYALAVGSKMVVYNLEAGEPSVCVDVGKVINSMLFIKEDVVAIGSDQPNILLYSTISGEEMASLKGHSSRVKGLALSPDHNLLFSASSDGSVKVWAISETLEDTGCVCSVDSGCRLTCITTILLQHPIIAGKEPVDKTRRSEDSKVSDDECEINGVDEEEDDKKNDEEDDVKEVEVPIESRLSKKKMKMKKRAVSPSVKSGKIKKMKVSFKATKAQKTHKKL